MELLLKHIDIGGALGEVRWPDVYNFQMQVWERRDGEDLDVQLQLDMRGAEMHRMRMPAKGLRARWGDMLAAGGAGGDVSEGFDFDGHRARMEASVRGCRQVRRVGNGGAGRRGAGAVQGQELARRQLSGGDRQIAEHRQADSEDIIADGNDAFLTRRMCGGCTRSTAESRRWSR